MIFAVDKKCAQSFAGAAKSTLWLSSLVAIASCAWARQAQADTAPDAVNGNGAVAACAAGPSDQQASSTSRQQPGVQADCAEAPVRKPAAAQGLSDSDKELLAERAKSPARFNELLPKGTEVRITGYEDSILQDKGRIRSTLADAGFSFVLTSVTVAARNLTNTQGSLQPALGKEDYWGQKLSAFNEGTLYLLYDTSRLGIPDGQISIGGQYAVSTYQEYTPKRVMFNNIYWYQTAFKKALEIKAGLYSGSIDWGGFTIGGGVMNPLGATASIPYEMGLASFGPQPAVSLKWNLGPGFYDKMGAMRSIGMLGPTGNFNLDDKKFNPSGLSFDVPNGKLLLMNELGFKRDAMPGRKSIWLRGAIMYNKSRFNDYSRPGFTNFNGMDVFNGTFGTKANVTAEYIMGDIQVTQTAPDSIFSAYRGLYIGGSFFNSPAKYIPINRSWEARAYVMGPFNARPTDMAAVAFIQTFNSKYLVGAANSVASQMVDGNYLSNIILEDGAKQFLFTYTAPITKGIYVTGGLGYINNPSTSYVRDHKEDALSFSLATFVNF